MSHVLTIYYTTTTIYYNRGPVYSPAFHTCILENKILNSRQQEHFFFLYLAQERLRARSQKWKHPTDKTGHTDILYPCCLEHCEVNLTHCRRILSALPMDMSNVCTESIHHSVFWGGGIQLSCCGKYHLMFVYIELIKQDSRSILFFSQPLVKNKY